MKKIILGALIALTTTTSLFAELTQEAFKEFYINKSFEYYLKNLEEDAVISKIVHNDACKKYNELNIGYNSSTSFTNEFGTSRTFDSNTFCVNFNEYFLQKTKEYKSKQNNKFIEKFIIFNIRGGQFFDSIQQRDELKKIQIAASYYNAFKNKQSINIISAINTMQSLVKDMHSNNKKNKEVGCYDSAYQNYLFYVLIGDFKKADSIIEKNVDIKYVENFWTNLYSISKTLQ